MGGAAVPPEQLRADASCDGGDLDCGSGLLLIIRRAMEPLRVGQVLEIRSLEASVREDLPAWCRMVHNELLGVRASGGASHYFVRKGGEQGAATTVRDDLETARAFRWRARVRWSGGSQAGVYARKQTFTVGQPISFGFGDRDEPPCAVELLLGALGGCLTVGFQVHASRRGVEVDEMELALTGQLNNVLVFLGLGEDGHPGMERISGTLYVSADAAEDELRQIWEETLHRSPIAATLRGRVTLDLKLSVIA